jgi:peptidoglycan/xylan/chitin deacetylase (PgdA/CDA1 family)
MGESPYRWAIKKAARTAVILGSLGSGSLAVRRLVGRATARVITYHRFGHVDRDPYCVAPEAFEEQMRWLAEGRLAVSLDEIVQFARGEREIPSGSVLVTMDDGFSSVLSVAAPVLRRYGIPAVAYVTTQAIGNPDAGKGAGEPFLTWEQIMELNASSVTIGSHGHTHRSMARLGPEEVRREGQQSKELIEDRLGREVNSFAYPYGMRGDENPMTAKILGDCGYSSVFVSQHGTVHHGTNPLRLPRVKVEAGEPLWMFKLLCQGGMDPWSFLDRVMWSPIPEDDGQGTYERGA